MKKQRSNLVQYSLPDTLTTENPDIQVQGFCMYTIKRCEI